MRCAWDAYIQLLPSWMREQVDYYGKDKLLDLRLRVRQPPELILYDQSVFLTQVVCPEDIEHVINAASQYSPWSAATISRGYLTAPGGHRIGVCGEAVVDKGYMTGIRIPTSLCIRVARDFPGIADQCREFSGSVLIIGRPGSGKTTLLRDLIRQRSNQGGESVAVLDERGEIFPIVKGQGLFPSGQRTDVMTQCNKQQGLDALIRTMGPGAVAVDEITKEEDCRSLVQAAWCGVSILATAHASNYEELVKREVYRPIIESKIFDTVLTLRQDKTWIAEKVRGIR